jgi:hypothetical protein
MRSLLSARASGLVSGVTVIHHQPGSAQVLRQRTKAFLVFGGIGAVMAFAFRSGGIGYRDLRCR